MWMRKVMWSEESQNGRNYSKDRNDDINDSIVMLLILLTQWLFWMTQLNRESDYKLENPDQDATNTNVCSRKHVCNSWIVICVS